MTTIIVIDDQPVSRRVLAQLAASVESDVEVAAFGDPIDALAYAEQKTPDLVITDYKMNSMNGDEFIRRFRHIRSCAQVPTVVVTAYQDVEFRDRAVEAGSTDFLLSPIDHNEFRTRSRSLLALRRDQQVGRTEMLSSLGLEEEASLADKDAADAQIEMVSEMLQNINSQLVMTLSSLEQANNDLQNLMEITQVAAVFIDRDMKVRRFTPASTAIYPSPEMHIGRHISEIKANLVYGDLESDLGKVAETSEVLERYLSSADGNNHYLVRVLPYRRADGAADGAALTFTQVGKWHSGRD